MPNPNVATGDEVLFVETDGHTFDARVTEVIADDAGTPSPEGRVRLEFYDPKWTPNPDLPGHQPHTVTDRISRTNPAYDPAKPLDEKKNWPAVVEEVEREVTPEIAKGRTLRAEGVPFEESLRRNEQTRCWRWKS